MVAILLSALAEANLYIVEQEREWWNSLNQLVYAKHRPQIINCTGILKRILPYENSLP
jgi:hypothetical protein